MNWADRLIEEYTDNRRVLSRMKKNLNPELTSDEKDIKYINSMIGSMTETIEWLKTGKDPKVMKGIHVDAVYQVKSIDMDLMPDLAEQLKDDINERHLYLSKEEKVLLKEIFSTFSEREKECYFLYEGHEKSMSWIAERLGLSKRTVQQYIERARMKVESVVGCETDDAI